MASLKAHEVDAWLARPEPSRRVVLFYGPDTGLVRERSARLCAMTAAGNDDPFAVVRLDADDLTGQPGRLADEALTIGLFGGRRTIRISGANQSLTRAVEPFLASDAPDALIVIEAGDLARGQPLRTAVERSASGIALPCFGDEGRTLERVIEETARAFGCSMPGDVRAMLAGRLGSDREISRREIEKLCLYIQPETVITAEAVDAVIDDNAVRGLNLVVDSVFAGRLADLDLALIQLRAEGLDAVVMLQGVMRHALLLAGARRAFAQGKPLKEIAGAARLPFPRWAALEAALKGWSEAALDDIVTGLGQSAVQCRRNGALAEALAERALWNIATTATRSRQRG